MAIRVQELAQSIEKVTLATAGNVGKGCMKMTKASYGSSQPLKVKLAEGLDLTCPSNLARTKALALNVE